MKLKEILERKQLKQCEVVRDTQIPGPRLNAFLNGWMPLPEKHIGKLANYLGLSPEQIRKESALIRGGR